MNDLIRDFVYRIRYTIREIQLQAEIMVIKDAWRKEVQMMREEINDLKRNNASLVSRIVRLRNELAARNA